MRWSLVPSSISCTFALIGGADIVEDEALIFRRLPDPLGINTDYRWSISGEGHSNVLSQEVYQQQHKGIAENGWTDKTQNENRNEGFQDQIKFPRRS